MLYWIIVVLGTIGMIAFVSYILWKFTLWLVKRYEKERLVVKYKKDVLRYKAKKDAENNTVMNDDEIVSFIEEHDLDDIAEFRHR